MKLEYSKRPIWRRTLLHIEKRTDIRLGRYFQEVIQSRVFDRIELQVGVPWDALFETLRDRRRT